MARNTYSNMGAEALQTFGTQAYSVLNGSIVYNIPAGDLTALNNAVTGLGSSITVGAAAEAGFHSAIADKNTDMDTLVAILSKIAPVLYNNPALTEAQIAATGYAVRDTGPTPVVPQEPLSPMATAFSNGDVDYRWSRNGNPYGVIFVIEQSADGNAWTFVSSTKRRRVTLSGFTPGAQKWLRVKATTSSQQSIWSASVAIYGPELAAELELAA